MDVSILNECKQFIENGGIPSRPMFQRIDLLSFGMMDIDPTIAKQYLEVNKDLDFASQLFAFIERTNEKDSTIYKRARIDRRLFSKIRSNKKYIPSKRTILALCIALELTRMDANQLLSSAGYSLSRADDFDLIIAFCLEKQLYDFFDINEVLHHFGFEPF